MSGFFQRMFERFKGGKAQQPEPEESDEVAVKDKQVLKAIKCDLCSGLPFEACVYNCPCTAITRVPADALAR